MNLQNYSWFFNIVYEVLSFYHWFKKIKFNENSIILYRTLSKTIITRLNCPKLPIIVGKNENRGFYSMVWVDIQSHTTVSPKGGMYQSL